MFRAALFTIGKTWRQPECPLIMDKGDTHTHTHTHTQRNITRHKKHEIAPFIATWMKLEVIVLSEVSQKEKDKHHMVSLTRGI